MGRKIQLHFTLVFVTIAASSGCMSPWVPGRPASNSVSVVENTQSTQADNLPSSSLVDSLEPNSNSLPKTNEEAMAAVMDELQEIGSIDHVAQQKLMAELREASPEEWPGIVQQFQSALAFREQLIAKESRNMAGIDGQQDENTTDSIYAVKEPLAPTSKPKVLPASTMAALSPDQGMSQVASAMLGEATTSRKALTEHLARLSAQSSTDSIGSEYASEGKVPPLQGSTNNHIMQSQSATSSTENTDSPVVSANAGSSSLQQVSDGNGVEQVNHVAPNISTQPVGSSQQHLQAAIASIEQKTQHAPTSVDDVQEQMRLRLLRLLAGQESAAMSPIPGASSTQQDYWSNQLFAISTYLDNHRQPDGKQRATGSLMHLDSARASLAELATLNVRNLTFVDSVDGFGVYKQHENSKFQPGEQVTLYTEVENFQSQSTKEGFHTQLSTSYEVVDMYGKQVDGAQFPDVKDLCRNQRHDFHMQYGVALPTHISPGQYILKLTITDQLSHKIGQTSVPFEIVVNK